MHAIITEQPPPTSPSPLLSIDFFLRTNHQQTIGINGRTPL